MYLEMCVFFINANLFRQLANRHRCACIVRPAQCQLLLQTGYFSQETFVLVLLPRREAPGSHCSHTSIEFMVGNEG